MPGNALTDPLLRSDLRSQELAYNNNTDRIKIELPQIGDPAASGSVYIMSSLGTSDIPVYFDTSETSWATLTEPGSTSSLLVSANSKHTFQYTINSIDTSVTVGASGSLDNANWFNLDANESLTTQTSNGTYGMIFDGMIKYVLFSFMEEVGGTNATVSARYFGGH